MANDNDDESFTKEFWKAEAIRLKELSSKYKKERDALMINNELLWRKLEKISMVIET